MQWRKQGDEREHVGKPFALEGGPLSLLRPQPGKTPAGSPGGWWAPSGAQRRAESPRGWICI